MYYMDTEGIILKAEIGLFKENMAGRLGYRTGVRPNHRVPGREYFFLGEITFETEDWLSPGDTRIGMVNCVIASKDRPLFKPGFKWEIFEASKLVGYGKCITVM